MKKKRSKLRRALAPYLPVRFKEVLRKALSKKQAIASPRANAPVVKLQVGKHAVTQPFPHLVVTRMMIGVSRPSAFNLHARILAETLLPSLAKQTFQGFHWVIVTDRLIDAASLAYLKEITAPYPNIHVELLDPFEQWTNVPDIVRMCRDYLGTTQNVITTRVDDDDALRLDFLEQVQIEARRAEAPFVSISYRTGVTVASDMRMYRMTSSENGASAGMSILSPDVVDRNVHSSGHNGLHDATERGGGVAKHLHSSAPYFLSGEHATSDSRERRDETKAHKRISLTYKPADSSSEAYVELLASFGLPADFDDRITTIRKTHRDHAPPLFDYAPGRSRPLSRLGLKRLYLNRAKTLNERLSTTTGKQREQLELEIHLLKQAHYLV